MADKFLQEVEAIIEIICDEYCRWPHQLEDQEAMDRQCDKCSLAQRIEKICTI